MKATRCSVDGCERGGKIRRGLCGAHYQSKKKHGEIQLLPIRSVADRLAAGLVRMPNGCLEWTRSRGAKGYGQIEVDGKPAITHRLAWRLVHGPIPDGLFVCHTCDNPPCCDVTHLWLGTCAQNQADMAAKGRSHK